MSDLLNSLKGQLSSAMVDQLASKFGENPSHITKAMGGLLPTVLGGLINKSGDSGVMSTVMGMLGNKGNEGLLDGIGGMIGGNNMGHNNAENPAAGMISALFGNKVDGVLGAISAFSGIKQSSASGLMGLASSLVMGYLSKKVAGGMGLSALTSMLTKEAPGIMAALPGGMSNLMGFKMPSMPNIPSVPSMKKSSNTGIWIGALAALGLFLFWWQGRNNTTTPAVATIEAPKVDSIAGTVAVAADSAMSKVSGFFKKLGNGFDLRGDSTGIESGLVTFIDSDKAVDKTTWFNFDHLNFQTGSAELDMVNSQNQLNNINEILKAYPKVNLKIGGYTDNTGGKAANTKLSQQRADNVMAALVGMGIDKMRLAAEGFGPQFPVCAANDTEECKAQNRRIAVRVSQK